MLNERLRSDAKPFFFYSICKEWASVRYMDWKQSQSLHACMVWMYAISRSYTGEVKRAQTDDEVWMYAISRSYTGE